MTKSTACPICKKPLTEKYRPFCSQRCSDLDLGRWLKGSYAIPADEQVPEPVAETEDDPTRH